MKRRSQIWLAALTAITGVTAIVAITLISPKSTDTYAPLPARPPTFDELMVLADEGRATNGLIGSYIHSQPDGVGAAKVFELAKSGDDEAELMSCYLLIAGVGIDMNENRGYRICETSAEKGFSAAKANLIYRDFNPDPQNMNWQETFDAFTKLKKIDPAKAHRGIQFLYRQDHPNASSLLMRVHLKEAIRHGSSNAMHALAEFDLYGNVRLRDFARAEKNLTRAYELNNFAAGHKLALLYRDGGKLEQDTEAFKAIVTRLAAFEYPDAVTSLAFMYDSGNGIKQDKNRAAELHTRAAELGNRDSMNRVGFLLLFGSDDPLKHKKGIEFLESSARLGNVQSMTRLVKHYSRPEINDPDNAKIFWQIQAALMGDLLSQEGLFWNYMDAGYLEEFTPYIRSLEAGHQAGYPEASYHLARQYRGASGVERDLPKAKQLLNSIEGWEPKKVADELDVIDGFIRYFGSIEAVPAKIR